MAHLNVGDKAPDFTLLDQNENSIALSGFRGKKVLIYFYPKADTPGCTQQSCSVRDTASQLTEKSIVALGISPDTPAKQKKFDAKFSLGFRLLCDTEHTVAESYGVWGEKSMYGKKYFGIIRSSFLIDESGTIIQTSYNVKPMDTIPNALNAIQ
ncbi:thioredoxin-dependent thiol peroxidase [bacterium]|nr:thioredoxin-dependent thiol peroxidase [bacterium]MCP5462294.1 thioredoxin-dependent thiol peroxidase [bacterium]